MTKFFRATGGLWARDATADEAFEDERRPWKGLREDGGWALRARRVDQ
jgi:hypothetical protein